MPQYQFRCPSCRSLYTVTEPNHPAPCPSCGVSVKRVWTFTTGRGMPEHFNNAIGEHVTNQRAFYDGLKRKSEADSIRTGMEHDYQPVDPSDMRDPSLHGVTEEGLDDTYRATFTKD